MLQFLINSFNLFRFQNPNTPVMEGIIDLHNYIFFYLIMIFIFICYWLIYIVVVYYIVPTFFYDFSLRKESLSDSWFFKYIFVLLAFIDTQFLYQNDFKYFKIDVIRMYNIVIPYYKNGMKQMALVEYPMISKLRVIYHFSSLEIIWTLIPSVILVLIAIPSFALLYAMEEVVNPGLTVKIVGYQWFWNYEYTNSYLESDSTKNLTEILPMLKDTNIFFNRTYSYDSVMLNEQDLVLGDHRLLEVDNQMILPTNVHIRVLVTAADVIHSWSVPSLGVKIDAVPGRLNQVNIFMKREGVFYGQCSELCGVNHGFMPIAVKGVSDKEFINWLINPEYVTKFDKEIEFVKFLDQFSDQEIVFVTQKMSKVLAWIRSLDKLTDVEFAPVKDFFEQVIINQQVNEKINKVLTWVESLDKLTDAEFAIVMDNFNLVITERKWQQKLNNFLTWLESVMTNEIDYASLMERVNYLSAEDQKVIEKINKVLTWVESLDKLTDAEFANVMDYFNLFSEEHKKVTEKVNKVLIWVKSLDKLTDAEFANVMDYFKNVLAEKEKIKQEVNEKVNKVLIWIESLDKLTDAEFANVMDYFKNVLAEKEKIKVDEKVNIIINWMKYINKNKLTESDHAFLMDNLPQMIAAQQKAIQKLDSARVAHEQHMTVAEFKKFQATYSQPADKINFETNFKDKFK